MRGRGKVLFAAVLVLIVVLTLTAVAQADDYSNHWSAPYIKDAAARGWMTGDGAGNFRPDAAITRGEFAVMLWRALGQLEPQRIGPFNDVKAGTYYYKAVASLAEQGVVTGFDAVTFGPNSTLTREMGCTMLARAYKLSPSNDSSYQRFADGAGVSAWAQAAVSALVEKGYIAGVGDNKFAPTQQLKRGELAKLLITTADGAKAERAANFEQQTTMAAIMSGPSISVRQTALGSDEVKITVSADSSMGIKYVGYQASSKGATYKNNSGFIDITNDSWFTVDANGWYAIYATNKSNNSNFYLFEVTSIKDGAPTVRLTQRSVDSNNVEITATVTSANADLVGWCASSEGGIYNREPNLTAISGNTFTVTENGWYAVFAEDANAKFGYRLIEVTGIGGGPSVSLVASPTTASAVSVTVTATVNVASGNTLKFVGWRNSDNSATYSNSSGFTGLTTSPYRFTVNSNGWYAVCVTDNRGGFSYAKIQITNIGTAAPTTYNVTVSADPAAGGSASGGGNNITAGTQTSVTATANPNYTFDGWYEGATRVSTNATYTFNVNADRTLVAKFIADTPPVTYTVSVSAGTGGSASVSGSGTFSDGASVTVTATADPGYHFVEWQEGGGTASTDNPYNFTATENRSLTAIFALDE